MRKMPLVFFALLLSLTQSLIGFEGFYAGASTGVATTVGNQDGNFNTLSTIEGTAFTLLTERDERFFHGKWEANIFAGYGGCYRCFYGGLEAFYRRSRSKVSMNRRDETFDIVTVADIANITTSRATIGTSHYGLDGRLGIMLNPLILLYGRIGVEWTRFNYTDFSTIAITDATNVSLSISNSKRRNQAHLRLGLGLEKTIFPHLNARVDYVFTHYGRRSLSGANAIPGLTIVDSIRVHPRDHSISIGLAYYLCSSNCCFNEPCLECPAFCGFYGGVAVGGAINDVKVKGRPLSLFASTALATNLFQPLDLGNHLQSTNFVGTLFGGFGYQWCRFYAGVEPFVKVSWLSERRTDFTTFAIPNPIDPATTITFSTTVRTRARLSPGQFGIDFRPGLLLSPSTLIYGKIGTSYAHLEMRSRVREFVSIPGVTVSNSRSRNRTVASLRVGAGFEVAYCPCWHIRADYLYTRYPTQRVRGVAAITDPVVLAISNNARFVFRSHDVTLGVARYF